MKSSRIRKSSAPIWEGSNKMAEPMLNISDINVYYGAIHAIKGISLTVNQGEIVTLIGANGAGKSTLLRSCTGLLKPKTGSSR